MKRIHIVILLLVFAYNLGFSQNNYCDSLKKVINASPDKLTQAQLYYKLADTLEIADTALVFAEKALSIFEKLKNSQGYSNGILQVADLKYEIGRYSESIDDFKKGIKYFTSINNRKLVAECINRNGLNFYNLGEYKKASENYYEALKIREEIKEYNGISECYSNLGALNNAIGDYSKAIEYYNKSMEMQKRVGNNELIALTYNNIGAAYHELGNNETAIWNYREAIRIQRMIKHKYAEAVSLTNIAGIYFERQQLDTAEIMYLKALFINDSLFNKFASIYVNTYLCQLYKAKNNFKKALHHAYQAYEIAVQLNTPEGTSESAYQLYTIFFTQQKYKEALEMYKLYAINRSKISNESFKKDLLSQQFKYDYEKKASEIETQTRLEKERIELKAEEEKKKKNIIIYSVAGILLIVSVFSFFVYRGSKKIKKANVIITEQKKEVEIQKETIALQKQIVEEKQHEIIDSINYAKRLQEAILPPQELVNKYLPENFLLYKPKDIVAGDFYWFEHIDGATYLAAADSTGHGVPGALVSVVCSNALNRAVNEFGLRVPGEILDKTRELVLETFARSDKDVKDGMDISLAKISENKSASKSIPSRLVIPKGQSLKEVIDIQRTFKIEWAGANNPLWFYHNGIIQEISAHKQPIGKTENPTDFQSHTIELNKGDMLYLFTDGFADQFGGPKGKKFKYKQMKEALLAIVSQPLEAQKQQLNNAFENWKGNLEQVDDVCIIGIKL